MKKITYIPGIGICKKNIEKYIQNKADIRTELGLTPENIMIISVGELNKNKNHKEIINCLAEIKNPLIHYYIIGSGPLRDYLKQHIKGKNMENYIHLLGYKTDVINYIDAADIFCFPSKREGLSVALMESMACKTPVICRRIRGNVDLIVDGKNGYCYSKVDELKEKLEILVDNETVRTAFAKESYDKLDEYEMDNVNSIMKKIYSSV